MKKNLCTIDRCRKVVFFMILFSIFFAGIVYPAAGSSPAIKEARTPVKPEMPSKVREDYVQAMQYMFDTGDYSLLDKMVGDDGVVYLYPSGVEFFPLGHNNLEDVKNLLKSVKVSPTVQCLQFENREDDVKFTVYFGGLEFPESLITFPNVGDPAKLPYGFLFWENQTSGFLNYF